MLANNCPDSHCLVTTASDHVTKSGSVSPPWLFFTTSLYICAFGYKSFVSMAKGKNLNPADAHREFLRPEYKSRQVTYARIRKGAAREGVKEGKRIIFL